MWCVVWFFIVEVFKVLANGLWDSSSNDGMSDLFMSPFSKFLLFNKSKRAEDIEEIDEDTLTESAKLALQMKRVVS